MLLRRPELLTLEREFIYQVHNIDNTYQLLQWQAVSGGISPSLDALAHRKALAYRDVHNVTGPTTGSARSGALVPLTSAHGGLTRLQPAFGSCRLARGVK